MISNKSKLFIKVLAVILIVMLGTLSFTACDLFLTQDEIDAKSQIEISVYIDNRPQKYTVKFGEIADIGVLVKSGYMISNVTDENGTEYFDFTGKSTSVWQKSYPTEFYANFVEVNNLSYTYSTQLTSAATVSAAGWEKQTFGFQGDERKQIQSALKGNASRKVKLTVTYRERGEGLDMFFRIIVNGDELVYSVSSKNVGATYVTTTREIELDARQLINGFSLQWKAQGLYFYYVKDLVVQVQFI